MKILFASKNPKKILELQRIAKEKIELICLSDIKEAENIPQVEENGTTFLENATIKAKYWANKLGIVALGEDSGIEIDALNGAPGVFTKRCIEQYCKCENVDDDKPSKLYPKILEAMKATGNDSKKAHWISSFVLAYPNSQNVLKSVSSIDGEMCECRGIREFGFDQYFMPYGSNKTLSEMEPEEKDTIGPRRKAFENILEQLDN